MINFNGTLLEENNPILLINNRGFNYGDAVFETIKAVNGKILFWEDHYFRLMASMRIMRMDIPMSFTPEFLESQIKRLIVKNTATAIRVKLHVYRDAEGLYLPNTNAVGFCISMTELDNVLYPLKDNNYTIDIYKDFFISPDLLSTLKTVNCSINTLGSIYASENGYDNCLILNTNKSVVEALNGNLFLVSGKTIKTPPLSDGCIKGIMRKQVIGVVNSLSDYELEEASISVFELQKANELFITNTISGIQPISKYRKKNFQSKVAQLILDKININIRLA